MSSQRGEPVIRQKESDGGREPMAVVEFVAGLELY